MAFAYSNSILHPFEIFQSGVIIIPSNLLKNKISKSYQKLGFLFWSTSKGCEWVNGLNIKYPASKSILV